MLDEELIATTDIPKVRGYIWWVGKDDKGNATIMRAVPRGRPKVPKGYKLTKLKEEQPKQNE